MFCTQLSWPLPPWSQHFTEPRLSGAHAVEDDAELLVLSSVGIPGMHHHAQLFCSGDRTQGLVTDWQALHQLSHMSRTNRDSGWRESVGRAVESSSSVLSEHW